MTPPAPDQPVDDRRRADDAPEIAAFEAGLDALRRDVAALRDALAAPAHAVQAELGRRQAAIDERAAIARISGARLLSDRIAIDGDAALRLRIRRIRTGDPVARRFSSWVGVTHSASASPDVRALWERLIDAESNREDDMLRGAPTAVLDIPNAAVSIVDGRLQVVMQRDSDALRGIVAIPRFTHALPPRKLRNFGHWLVDCVPQVAVLASLAPDAKFLLPPAQKPFQEWALGLAGVRPEQVVAWDGAPVAAGRVLALESDGRTGGGRPLSSLTAFRQSLIRGIDAPRSPRRIYVTRRDARKKRKWVSNQEAIEQLFQSRGFEVVSMAECPLDEQARLFREAGVVAGVSGAGLTDLIFSAPGTHVIVLLSDSLIRWYADQRGARSLWAVGARGRRGLAALGDSPRFYAHLAAAFEQYCHSFVGADEMDLDQLGGFLDDVLARVDAG